MRSFVPGQAVFLSDGGASPCRGRTFVDEGGAQCISLQRLPEDLVGLGVILHLRTDHTEGAVATLSQRVASDGSVLIRIPPRAGALYEVARMLVGIEVVADSA